MDLAGMICDATRAREPVGDRVVLDSSSPQALGFAAMAWRLGLLSAVTNQPAGTSA
jgi:hypothetical protein